MFKDLDIDDGVEGAFAEGQLRNVAEDLDFRIVPGFVADAAVQSHVMGMREKGRVGALAGTSVQDHGTRGKFAGGFGEMFEQDGMKRVDPAHDEARHQRLDQLPEFCFKHGPLYQPPRSEN